MQDFLPFHARDAEDAFRTVRLQPTEGSGCSGGVKVTFVAPDNVSVYDNFGCPNEYVLPDINTPLLLAFRIGGSVAGGGLHLARNEIFARYGRGLKTKALSSASPRAADTRSVTRPRNSTRCRRLSKIASRRAPLSCSRLRKSATRHLCIWRSNSKWIRRRTVCQRLRV